MAPGKPAKTTPNRTKSVPRYVFCISFFKINLWSFLVLFLEHFRCFWGRLLESKTESKFIPKSTWPPRPSQDRPKGTPRGPKSRTRGQKGTQKAPKRHPRAPKKAPKKAKRGIERQKEAKRRRERQRAAKRDRTGQSKAKQRRTKREKRAARDRKRKREQVKLLIRCGRPKACLSELKTALSVFSCSGCGVNLEGFREEQPTKDLPPKTTDEFRKY